jgi:hypothetical protein
MPRVGDTNLVNVLSAYDLISSANPIHPSQQRNYRAIHLLDGVPDSILETETSPAPTRDYRHTTPSFNLTAAAYTPATTNNIKMVDGISQNNGGSLLANFFDPTRHSFYFGNISACS